MIPQTYYLNVILTRIRYRKIYWSDSKGDVRKMIFKVFYSYPSSKASPEAVMKYFQFDNMDDLMDYFDNKGLTVLYAKEVVDTDEMAEFNEKVGA